jgi:hypothetical protein
MVETRQCYRAVYPKSQSLHISSCNTEESRWLDVSKSQFFVLAATQARKGVLESGVEGYTGPVRFQGPSRSDWRPSVFAPHRRRPAQSDSAAPHPSEPRLHLPLLLTGEANKDPGGRVPESNGDVSTASSHAFRIRGLRSEYTRPCTYLAARAEKETQSKASTILCPASMQVTGRQTGRQTGR